MVRIALSMPGTAPLAYSVANCCVSVICDGNASSLHERRKRTAPTLPEQPDACGKSVEPRQGPQGPQQTGDRNARSVTEAKPDFVRREHARRAPGGDTARVGPADQKRSGGGD